ncbi:hypothetical protein BHE74_00001604 [Ensete ventricosum]|nr:hypothetical protein GW17_00011037 [Ensete ventricosum]RWW89451.1 hypothetical protein BHE74_00001604 [Ensete ventricosum]
MVGSVGNGLMDLREQEKVEPLPREFDPGEIVHPKPPPETEEGVGGEEGSGKSREIVLGRNVHTMCFAIKEPEADDEVTGEREAYMASVLARYRRSLIDRTKHHLGYPYNLDFDYGALGQLQHFSINNLGDPFIESNYGVHSRQFEVGVLDWFARIWELEKNEYWGYITNCGTEGNLHGTTVKGAVDDLDLFVGCPMPCGVQVTRLKHINVLSSNVEYLASRDATIMGSRNGHAPIFLWYTLNRKGYRGFQKEVKKCLRNAHYLKDRLKEAGISVMLNELSSTVVFERPKDEEFVRQWQLACEGNIAHVVVMPNVTADKLDTFLNELLRHRSCWYQEGSISPPCIAADIGEENCCCMSSTSTLIESLVLEIYSRRLLLHTSLPRQRSPPTPWIAGRSDSQGRVVDPTVVVVVLAALLCALVCALCLNSILRCALRWSNRPAQTGLRRKALQRLPRLVYSAGVRLTGAVPECAICLSELVPGEHIRVLPSCNHGFHLKCIDRWLTAQSSCPTCRRCMLVAKTAACAGEGQPGPPPVHAVLVPLEPEGLVTSHRS